MFIKSRIAPVLMVLTVLAGAAAFQAHAEQQLAKQPVFLFCPHSELHSAWSLSVLIDKNDPAKPLALVLDELSGKNSKQLTYDGVLKAQKDPNTSRVELSRLDAKEFGSGRLEVHEKDLLQISVNPSEDGTLKLTVNARIGLDEYFTVGGAQQGKRNMFLQYSHLNNKWIAKSSTLEAIDGHNAVRRAALPLTGIVFVAGVTSVSRIAAVDDLGSAILLMDR